MWELDYKESWALKNWCFWTLVLEKTLERPLNCKEIQPVNSKGNQSWIFSGRTDAEAETPILWPPDAKNWLFGKDSDAGRDLGQEEKGTREDWDGWMASPTRWTWVWVNSGSSGQGGLACCDSWGRKELDTTEWLNWTELMCLDAMISIFWMLNFKPAFSPSSIPGIFQAKILWVGCRFLLQGIFSTHGLNPLLPGFPVLHYLPEFAQTYIHWVSDAIQPSPSLSPPSPPAFNLSQHQGLFQWVGSSHQVAKVLELQLQYQSFQRIFGIDFL